MVMLKISWVHTSASAMTDLMITTEKKKVQISEESEQQTNLQVHKGPR